jgi:hypothetical protein
MIIQKLYNILSLGGRRTTATLLYLSLGLMLHAFVPVQMSSIFAQNGLCGGEALCEDGETCCDGACCTGKCCHGNCVDEDAVCCEDGSHCPSGQKCCHGNCIPEDQECCQDGTGSNCGCCFPSPDADKTTAKDCSVQDMPTNEQGTSHSEQDMMDNEQKRPDGEQSTKQQTELH